MSAAPDKTSMTFRAELADFWRFVRRPTLAPRLSGRTTSTLLEADFSPGIRFKRLLLWAVFLWVVNLCIFGPIAAIVAGKGGAKHRLDVFDIPWLTAVLWAPIVEEMLFRYGLRRPVQALWLCPLLIPVLLTGPEPWSAALLGVSMMLLVLSVRSAKHWRITWRRKYRELFPWVFHVVTVLFAGIHIANFSLNQTAYWLLPLLVLPQWVTGLVLGWMRVRRGIGASMALHALFNAVPVLMVWLLIQLLPSSGAQL